MDRAMIERPRFRAVNLQGWHDLTFLHWPYPTEVVQRLLPPDLEVETADGAAWVGVTPFRMHAVRPAGLPPLPHVSFFPEVNCRTYVRHRNGTSGVWFFSLDTPRLWIIGALRVLGLPYLWSRMTVTSCGGLPARRLEYRSSRVLPPRRGGTTQAGVSPLTAGSEAEPGPVALHAVVEVGEPLGTPGGLLDFLTARWWAFTRRAGRTWQVPADHPAWPLYEAVAPAADATGLLRAAGLPAPRQPPLVHFSPGVRTRLGLPRPS